MGSVETAIAKWGNSLAIRLPRSLAAEIGLQEGTAVDLQADGGVLTIRPARPRYRLADLLARLDADKVHEEVDWGGPQGEEAW
jgi:antitoxin MazE